MTTDEHGRLVVDLATPSVLFNNTAPIEVRDESLQLVQSLESGKGVQLPPGLYQVSAVLQDGREHKQIAKVEAGKVAHIEFVRKMGASAQPMPDLFGESFEVEAMGAPAPAGAAPQQALTLSGALIEEHNDGQWRLRAAERLTAMPTAAVRVGDTTWHISLPVYLGDGDCLLRVDEASQCPVTAWVAPERTMVCALQNMLLRGEFASLAPVAEQAIELLRKKYKDPCGATLGALILHKLGRLQSHQGWLENLARDFAWIPDGDILLASLRVQDHRDMETALELALSAARRRPLYAESFSLLLDMLRRWPKPQMVEPHLDVVASLARLGSYVAWKSLHFCHVEPPAR